MTDYRPRLSWEDDCRVNVPSITVLEPETQARKTGLLDANGNALMAVERREPIGFVTSFKRKSIGTNNA